MGPIGARVKPHRPERPRSTAMDDTERGYTITREYDAPRPLVWRAISEAELFARWFGDQTELTIHEWDLRPGGEWRGTMVYEGGEIPWTGRFMEIDEPNRLVV